MKVAVLMGGVSEERDVSLATGVQVAGALREAGHEVVTVDTARGALALEEERALVERGVGRLPPELQARDALVTGDLTSLLRQPGIEEAEMVFLALHGGAGEDGTLQGLLDLAGVPYTGSGRAGCTLAMDKEVTKRLLRDAGVPTPAWISADPDGRGGLRVREGTRAGPLTADRVEEALGLPVIAKASGGGSSLRLVVAHDRPELDEALRAASGFEDTVLVERMIQGREVTVGVVGPETLPVGEIVPSHEIFDYECKYQPGMAEEIFPADLSEAIADRLRALARDVHRLLRLEDYSRVDFILDPEGTAWCLEANALPGMTGNSLLPRAARAAGVSFPELCDRIVRLAAARRRPRDGGT